MPTLTDAPKTETIERDVNTPQSEEEAAVASSLPEDIQGALRDLMRMGERESDFARRGHYKEMLEAEEFWKGNQYPIWSDKEFAFRTPWDYSWANGRLEDQPTYQYVVNIYQASGLTMIASLSQKVPKVRFFPHSANSEVDIATARAASDVAELIEKNNKLRIMAIREAYLLWTQGGFGTYTRFVRDKKLGIEDVPVIEQSQVQVAPDRYTCQGCGAEHPADTIAPTDPGPQPGFGQPSELASEGQVAETDVTPTSDDPTVEADDPSFAQDDAEMEAEPQPGGMSCPQCGYGMSDADFVPGETAQVPVISGYKQVPEGFEKMSVYGLLNLKMMPYVQSFNETGYLQLVEDVHEGAIRAAYFGQQQEIGSNSGEAMGSNSMSASETDTYEKVGRMRLYDAPSPYSGLRSAPTTSYLTYKRVWMRRWYLMGHPDPIMRVKLFNMFPSGAYVAFAGEKFLEARDEDVDDYWTICSAMPSYGIYPEAVGSSTIPLQKQINDAANIVAEHLDFGSAPPVFYDAEFISGEGLRNQKMRPGNFYPIVRNRGGMARSIKELMHQPDIKIDANIYGYGRSLIELVQVVSGVVPSMFGGELKGNDTLGAYQQSRDQAIGKFQIFWAAVKQHHADAMRQGVECFRRNRTGDAEKVILGKSNEFTSKYIQLSDMRGNIHAEPEADEDFPQTWNEIRANFAALMESNPEAANLIMSEPANLALYKKYLGSPSIVFSAEANREKQFREIDELSMAAPIPVPDMMGAPDPMTGQPPVKWMPTVMPDVHGDDHVTHIKSIMEWVVDPEGGIIAKKENPEGYANTMAHLIAHKEAIAQLAAFDAHLQVEYGLVPVAPAPGQEGDSASSKPEAKAPPSRP